MKYFVKIVGIHSRNCTVCRSPNDGSQWWMLDRPTCGGGSRSLHQRSSIGR